MNFDADYQTGQLAFERGDYRQAVSLFMTASAQVQSNTRIGGEVQIWLVMAYEADGQASAAKELCRKLANHPSLDTRQASKRMLYIMEAPELARRDDWLTKIPDLSHLEDREGKLGGAGSSTATFSQPKQKKTLEERYPPVDLSQVNTQEHNFIAIALIFTVIVLCGLLTIVNFN